MLKLLQKILGAHAEVHAYTSTTEKLHHHEKSLPKKFTACVLSSSQMWFSLGLGQYSIQQHVLSQSMYNSYAVVNIIAASQNYCIK